MDRIQTTILIRNFFSLGNGVESFQQKLNIVYAFCKKDIPITMKLVIVESPAKCKKIQSYLGKGFTVKASFGHFREIQGGLKGIQMDMPNSTTSTPTFVVSSSKRKYVNELTKYVKQASQVYLATDDDREGEAIAWHLCDYYKLPVSNTPRLLFHEITKSAIQKAISQPTTLDMNKVHAQFARQVLDLLIGFTISPILTRAIPAQMRPGPLSAGRCQTPTLRLVYDNQQEIDKNPPKQTYRIVASFFKKQLEFVLTAIESNQQDVLDEWLSSSDHVSEFLETSKTHKHRFTRGETREKTHRPPQPFTTSTFQQSANTVCHMSPKQAMMTAQKLYEAGFITYMRTDSKHYSTEFVDTANQYIQDTYGEEYIGHLGHLGTDQTSTSANATKKSNKTKKAKKTTHAQEAHEAIRPTNLAYSSSELKDAYQRKIYDMIWKNTVASCMSSAKGLELVCTVTCPSSGTESPDTLAHYLYREEQLTFLGWKILYDATLENPIYHYLMNMKPKGLVNYRQIQASPTLKHSKQHYTEAGLVKRLEQKGIGRPSTFSYLIDKIQHREYVKRKDIEQDGIQAVEYTLEDKTITEKTTMIQQKERNKLIIQEIGNTVVEFLTHEESDIHRLFAYEYTATMETQLDQVAKGDLEWMTVIQDCRMLLNDSIPETKTKAQEMAKERKIWIAGSLEAYKTQMKEKQRAATASIGTWEGNQVFIKEGKYGKYAQLGKAKDSKKVSLSALKDVEVITMEHVEHVLKDKANASTASKSVIRTFTKEITLRNGKYGEYIMIRKPHMTKPKFMNCKKYPGDIHTDSVEEVLEWIERNYS